MSQKLTRRQIAASFAFAVPALSQQPVAPAPPATSQEVEAARDRNRNLAKELAAVPLPLSTGPAFQFKA